ncbi:hypothetical protein NLX86_18785 [Streptomyces sp. A3M-1-3]|uniref:hypothetical protein n=1 Tax=Streptomyces sp. A3M-1-3 TaxID=2962044 RepID=UPI0020B6FB86|nr:hypothetical protein [Streptomyces sp. A3M-1-3]MCP3820064.1 hypothetical protein [Streptomyces sp. A3M-1-3]
MTVHMRHPDLPETQQIEVGEAAVPLHRAAGWVAVEQPRPVEPAPASEPSADAETAPSEPARKSRRGIADKEND